MEDPKPPENRNINTDGGNYNERIEGDYIQGNVFQNIFNILGGQTTIPVGNPSRPKNERILLAAVKKEVTARLRQSLHNAVLINLGKKSQPQQVKRPWDAEIKIGLKPTVPLLDTTTTLEVFDSEEIAGKLLILGAPGAGKTTTQLELAQGLIKQAEEQPDYPVPVLFNLSSWKDDRQSLADWLVAELKSKYGVSNKLGKEWVDNHQLLPMLDGLDELETQRQELCVHAINQFLAGENRPLSLVVCSRSEEYSNYSTQLQLNGAIYLQPLSNRQICDYLTTIKYRELWSIISNDLSLLELVKTPLLLTITVLASQEISIESWQYLKSTADRLQYLLDAYVERMLTRDSKSKADFKNKLPNRKQTRMWLVWLAQQMQRESKTEFLIEEMQPSWLKKKISKVIYNLIVWGLIGGLSLGLLSGLSSMMTLRNNNYGYIMLSLGLPSGLSSIPFALQVFILIYGLISGLLSGLFFGMIFGLIGELIENQIEKIKLINSSEIYRIKNLNLLTSGLITGLIFGLFYTLMNKWILPDIPSAIGMITGIFAGMIGGMIGGVIGDEIKTVEKIKLSLEKFRKGMNFGLIAGLIVGRISEILYGLINGLLFGLISGVVVGLISGILYVIDSQEIENKTIPNQGIAQSFINSIVISIIITILSTFLIFVIEKTMSVNINLGELLIYSLVNGVLFGLFIGIVKSGTPAIKHFILRLVLYCTDYIPWNYARFLDYCTERLFLQRVGGRYRFIHRLLQDHFAQMDFK